MAKKIPWKVMSSETGRKDWLSAYVKDQERVARWFMGQLVKSGVPRSALGTTDFHSSTPRVYITIPYGRPGGGRNRGYQRWNPTTVKQAVKFYKSGGK